jgi:hypothetical protein
MIGYLVGHANDTIDAILANWAEKAYLQSMFHDAAVDNATDNYDELVSSAKAALAEHLELFKAEASSQLDAIFTSEFDITAVHPGNAPLEMVKPAGRAAMRYCSVHDGMHTFRGVLATNEIKSFKFERETDLYCRAVNLTNQVGYHACSAYCWNMVGYSCVPYSAHRYIGTLA